MLISYLILLVLVQPLAEVVLRIGPYEMAAIGIWGMVLLGSIGGSSVVKGLFAAGLGILFGTVGMNTAGYMRGDMGIPWLLDGIPTIPAMVGLPQAAALVLRPWPQAADLIRDNLPRCANCSTPSTTAPPLWRRFS